MSKQKVIIGAVLGLVLVASGSVAAIKIAGSEEPTPKVQSQSTPVENEAQDNQSVTFTAVADKTVLEQLQQQANVEVKDSDYGPFVESINGVKGGDKYWVFYVDGQMANVGAGEYKTTGGEKIEWKFE